MNPDDVQRLRAAPDASGQVTALPPRSTCRNQRAEPPFHSPALLPAAALERVRVIRLIDSAVVHPFTLIQAAAGFGKTTALAQWAAAQADGGTVIRWLSLHDVSRDPPAVERLLEDVLETAPDDASAQDFKSLAVLDDYHAVASDETDRILWSFLQRCPASVHIVLAARRRPVLPLAKMIAAGRACILGTGDLRFTREETAALAALHGVERNALASFKDAMGWPVALGLAAAAQTRTNGREDARRTWETIAPVLQDYFHEQVYRPFSDAQRRWLVVISILDVIDAGLACLLSGETGSTEWLSALAREHLFVSYDVAARGYRLHPLFRRFLRGEAERLGRDTLRQLHRRAFDWYMERSEPVEAARHARLAEDVEASIHVLENAGGLRVAVRDGMPYLQDLLMQIPPDRLHEFPRAGLARSLLLSKSGRILEALHQFESIRAAREQLIGTSTWPADSQVEEDFWTADMFLEFYLDRSAAPPDVIRLEAKLARTDPQDPWKKALLNLFLFTKHFRLGDLESAARATEETRLWCIEAGAPYSGFFTDLHLGAICLERNRPRAALEHFTRAERLAEESFSAEQSLLIQSRALSSCALYQMNQLEAAEAKIAGVLEKIGASEAWLEIHAAAFLTAAAIAHCRTGSETAFEILDQANTLAVEKELPRLRLLATLKKAELACRAGDGDLAASLLAQAGVDRDAAAPVDLPGFTWREQYLARVLAARILVLQGQPAVAVLRLQEFQEEAQCRGWLHAAARARVVEVLALEASGRMETAVLRLDELIDQSISIGAKRLLVDEGPAMARLLNSVIRHHGAVQVRPEKLEFMADVLASLRGWAEEEATPYCAVLSPRERQILTQLRAGFSNKAIARHFDLTENTVKFHLRNIYEKLGVRNRAMAVAVAEKLSLLGGA